MLIVFFLGFLVQAIERAEKMEEELFERYAMQKIQEALDRGHGNNVKPMLKKAAQFAPTLRKEETTVQVRPLELNTTERLGFTWEQ